MSKARILIIDDEVAFGQLATKWLGAQGYECVCCTTTDEAKFTFKAQVFDLVLLDLALPPTFLPQEGLTLLSIFNEKSHEKATISTNVPVPVPVIVMTGHAERELALKAIELGAWDFLSKPLDLSLIHI